jgi:hypothetical protein
LTATSWNFFTLLGRSPIAGRAFLEGEDAIGGPGGHRKGEHRRPGERSLSGEEPQDVWRRLVTTIGHGCRASETVKPVSSSTDSCLNIRLASTRAE